MNPEIKDKWVKALKSGEYKQGLGVLKFEDRFCCLGVLCDLYIKEHKEAKFNKRGVFINNKVALTNTHLPSSVMKWADIEDENVTLNNEYRIKDVKSDTLIQINDRGASFEEIANIIKIEL